MDNIKSIYKELAGIPVLESARVFATEGNVAKIHVRWSGMSLERREKVKSFQEYEVDLDQNIMKPASFPIDVSSELLTAHSQDESLIAILREVKADGKSKQFIEIWNRRKIIANYDLAAYDVHGKVYTDSAFASFELSPDNKKLMYIAEKKLQKCVPFFQPKSNPSPNQKAEPEIEGCEYEFKPNWGETLEDKHRSVVVILDLSSETIKTVEIEDTYFPAQTIWASNSRDIAGVVYKLEPRYLGVVFCTNRESYIFRIKDDRFRILTEKGHSCRSPRLSPDGKYLVFITRAITPPHHNSQSFKFICWDDEQEHSSPCGEVESSLAGKYCGLYNQSFPKRCWSRDSKYLFVSTPNVWTQKSYYISAEKSQVIGLVDANEDSLVVLDVYKNLVVFARSSLSEPSYLVVAKFENEKIGKLIGCCQDEFPLLKMLHYKFQLLEYKSDASSKKTQTYNYIYLGMKMALEKSLPVVVILHGGPNSVINNEFNLIYALFALLGFGVLLINYRGSAGGDSETLESLLGHIGENDYEDCLNALGFALLTTPELDHRRMSLFGGSHGGFLTAHISARNSKYFKAAVMRNPVIDIAAMFTISDIPDWCTAQIKYTQARVPEEVKPPVENNINLKRDMLLSSPTCYVDKCTVPTMIALGTKDLRCPPSQGKLWYYHLKKNNVDTKLYLYNDNHSLNHEAAVDFHMNAALWLWNYCQQDERKTDIDISELLEGAQKLTSTHNSAL